MVVWYILKLKQLYTVYTVYHLLYKCESRDIVRSAVQFCFFLALFLHLQELLYLLTHLQIGCHTKAKTATQPQRKSLTLLVYACI